MDAISTFRIFTGGNGSCQNVRWLHISGDSESDIPSHKFFVAGWRSPQAHAVGLCDLEVKANSGVIEDVTYDWGPTTGLSGPCSGLQCRHIGQDRIVVIAASEFGTLARIVLRVGRLPQEIGDFEEVSSEADWTACHYGGINSMDVSPDGQRVLTAGADGALVVTPLQLEAGDAALPFRRRSGTVSYRHVCWADNQTFVTSALAGGLQVWDTRKGGGAAAGQAAPLRRSPGIWGRTGALAMEQDGGYDLVVDSLAVHPARPNLCATSTRGAVALWDLRFAAEPLAWRCAGVEGEVWQVSFDCAPQGGGPADGSSSACALLLCSSDGKLASMHCSAVPGSWGEGAGGQAGVQEGATSLLAEEPGSLEGFDADNLRGEDLIAATDRQCLVYVRRRASG